jgi:hypothetical protein
VNANAVRPDLAVLTGAIDLYVHSNPDLIARRGDDFELAEECRAAGLTAAVHRNHYGPTAERSRVVRGQTGFLLLGAILLNGPVGGVNPAAVDLALKMGAVWIGFPTVGAEAYRARLDEFPAGYRQIYGFGRGDLTLTDSQGRLLPVVEEVLDLAVAADAVVNTGYAAFPECLALARAAAARGAGKVVVTNALSTMRLTIDQIDQLMEVSGTFLEVTAHSFHPSLTSHGRAGSAEGDDATAATLGLIRRFDAARCVLSSDGGIATAPPATEMLAAGCHALLAAGLAESELDLLIRQNPRHLVGAGRLAPLTEVTA